MSEELRQKGYLKPDGHVKGDVVGDFEGFNVGASTLSQLRKAGIVPSRSFGARGSLKPDGLVVDRRGTTPEVKLVVEYKNRGELASDTARQGVFKKTAEDYCIPLTCPFAAISDGVSAYWISVDTAARTWQPIRREDGYPLDVGVDLASPEGRELIARTLNRLRTEFDANTATLQPVPALNPTQLAEQTWQTIWLASGESPDVCLASFVEILIFKFLSDLKILTTDPAGVPVDFETVLSQPTNRVLRYYFESVRPEIKRLFPPGPDGTSVINGIVLDPANEDHGRLFSQILDRFASFGTLRRIDPEFKSRIFERFLKKSISQKNWGQFFTPRNVVKAMVEMSGIEHLTPGAVMADPACGVGGFVLEPLVHKRPHDFRTDAAPNLAYRGWDRDSKTIILAKANMLIHLSEVLESDPANAAARLAPVLNETFRSVARSITGSLALAPDGEFDLLMTNPPYVVTGTSTQRSMIAESPALAAYYEVPGTGVENLFLQLIIRGLKSGARALVIVPDGLLLRHSEEALRRHLLNTCKLEAVISLPKNTFYSTPKKTYILAFRKKQVPGEPQVDPVLTYLIGDVGETLDAKRFVIQENDLPRVAQAFRLFQGSPSSFAPTAADARLKVQPIDRFKPEEHWLVDRWWTEDERRALGEFEGSEAVSPEDLAQRLEEVASALSELARFVAGRDSVDAVGQTRTVSLGDASLFRLGIGRRVLMKELFRGPEGDVPLYSANVVEPFGYLPKSSITDFSFPSVLWGIDGNFEIAVKDVGVGFDITDHCGRIEILDPGLDAHYCGAAIALARVHGFDRTLRPSLTRMKGLTFEVPVRGDGPFDLDLQRALAGRYEAVSEALREADRVFAALVDLEPDVMLPSAKAGGAGVANP